jgi:uncharacterized damage-inducible protein DinB
VAAGAGIETGMPNILQSLYDHLAWADARLISHVAAVPVEQVPAEVVRLLGHVVAAERVWLLRIRGEDASAAPIWPSWTLAHIQATARENAAAYAAIAAADGPDNLQQVAEYRNSQGVAFRTPVIDILTQVAVHGAYHRGQIALALKAAGIAPVNTDYITFVRERAGDESHRI